MRFRSFLLTAVFWVVVLASGHAGEPLALFLTWKEDPLRSMVVDWQQEKGQTPQVFFFRKKGGGEWKEWKAEERDFPFSDRKVFRAALTGLEPGTEYEFRIGEDGRVYSFRTMPEKLDQPLRIAAGGDVRHEKSWMEEMNRVVMKYDPAFIVWGGDLAYANGDPQHVDRWYEFFDAIKETFVTPEGRVVPVVVSIGNHEVQKGTYLKHEDAPEVLTEAYREKIAPFFYGLMAFPGQPGYGALDFGNYLRLIVLDSNHTNPVPGEQTEWLRGQLKAAGDFTHVIPVYHVPAYPSAREVNSPASVSVRENWTPLFDEARLPLALEHHDHAYKRTVPIRAGKQAEGGTVYVGDGAWGVKPRETMKQWYLAKSATVRHGILIDLLPDGGKKLRVYTHKGDLLDEFELPVR